MTRKRKAEDRGWEYLVAEDVLEDIEVIARQADRPMPADPIVVSLAHAIRALAKDVESIKKQLVDQASPKKARRAR